MKTMTDEQKAAIGFAAIGVMLMGAGVGYLWGLGGFLIYLGACSFGAALIVVK